MGSTVSDPQNTPTNGGGNFPGDILATYIYNSGDEPVIVRVNYEGYDRTFQLAAKQTIVYPVRIPREAISVYMGDLSKVKVIYTNETFNEIPFVHGTVGGYYSRRGRFKIPGIMGNYDPGFYP